MIGHNSGAVAGNWIAISRDMRDHPIVGFGQPVKPADPKRGAFSRAEAWMDLIMEARWAPGQINNKGKVVELARGALMAARSWLASRWNWTENTVRWFLDKLEKSTMVRRDHHHSDPKQRRHYANVLVIENYDVFQTASELARMLPDKPTTIQPPINNHSTTIQPPESNKETKEQKNYDYRELAPRLFEAGGAALNRTAASLEVMSEPRGWLAQGCDLEEDILPAIRAVAARTTAGRVSAWRYFASAVAEARDKRLKPLPDAPAVQNTNLPAWKAEVQANARRQDALLARLSAERKAKELASA